MSVLVVAGFRGSAPSSAGTFRSAHGDARDESSGGAAQQVEPRVPRRCDRRRPWPPPSRCCVPLDEQTRDGGPQASRQRRAGGQHLVHQPGQLGGHVRTGTGTVDGRPSICSRRCCRRLRLGGCRFESCRAYHPGWPRMASKPRCGGHLRFLTSTVCNAVCNRRGHNLARRGTTWHCLGVAGPAQVATNVAARPGAARPGCASGRRRHSLPRGRRPPAVSPGGGVVLAGHPRRRGCDLRGDRSARGMPRVAGVDGCKKGWVVAVREVGGGPPEVRVVERLDAVLHDPSFSFRGDRHPDRPARCARSRSETVIATAIALLRARRLIVPTQQVLQ